MSGARRTIAKNAGVLMASQLITWALTLLLTIFLPRYLGAAAVGKFHFANSIWAIVAIVIVFGGDTLLTKEIARDPARAADYLGASLILRGLLFILGCGALWGYLAAFSYPGETRLVVFIIGAGSLLWQFIGACQATLQGLERMEYISLSYIAGKVAHTGLALTLLLLGQGVYVIAGVGAAAALVTLTIQLYFLRRLTPIHLRLKLAQARHMLRAGLPYLMSGIFLVVYMQVDIVIISLLVNDTVVGWYGAADQLFGAFLFIPTVFITAVFPALSRLYANKSDALPRLMSKSSDLLILLSIPIGLGVLVVAGPLVVLLFGPEFAQSGPILALLGIVLILTYHNMLLGQFLISTDRQNVWTIVMAVATLATLPLDFLLIPWCQATWGNGGLGGALSFIITELGMVVAGILLLPKGSLGRANLWVAVRALLAGLAMAAAAWWLRGLFIAIPIIVGAIVYVGTALLLGLAPREDVELLRSLAAGVLSRLRPRRASAIEGG
jgi:O-antigen/teichoic acid export membrane protein